MDARHESFKQDVINHLLTLVNQYVAEQTDHLVADSDCLAEISHLCEPIYDYVGIDVDVHNILSKHNLLSIDVVLFPHVDDPEASQSLSEAGFKKLIAQIKLALTSNTSSSGNNTLKTNILNILAEYKL